MTNNIILHGRFGRDPELEYKNGQNGQYAHVAFSIAVDRSYGDGTDWFYCVMNGKRAEVINKWFRKGSQIVVTGRMESYKSRKDPNVTNWVVVVTDFDFCDRQEGQRTQSAQGSAPAQEPQFEPRQQTLDDVPDSFEEAEDDIPF